MDINTYLARQYDLPPCWSLVSDVYTSELGCSISKYTSSTSFKDIANAFRLALHNRDHGFIEVGTPSDYCIVLLGKKLNSPPHHVGVFYKNKILHALATGNLYQDISSISDQFKLIRYMELIK